MQETSLPLTSALLTDVIEYYEIVADELDACHPAAFEVIYDIFIRKPEDDEITQIISDFAYEFGEDLEACNEEAYDLLFKIMQTFDIA